MPENIGGGSAFEAEFLMEKRMVRSLVYYHAHRDDEMLPEAMRQRDLAINHRGFHVGAVALAEAPPGSGKEFELFPGYNVTPEPRKKGEGGKKPCAERAAIEIALQNGAPFIGALATVSSEVDTGEGGPVHDVLHPCPECRAMFRKLLNEKVMSPATMMCNARDVKKPDVKKPDGSIGFVIEERTLAELLEKYKSDVAT